MAANSWYERDRLSGLRRFALSLSVFNLLGHTVLGFEQAWVHPFAGLAAAYGMEVLLELVDALVQRRRPRFLVSPRTLKFYDFFLSAHISGLAAAMLLYSNDQVLPVVFAAAAAIASKVVFRATVAGSARHYMNPSNFGITLTLIAFPWVGIAPPYQFTAELATLPNLCLIGLIITLGTLINRGFTRRLPLIGAWLVGFALQACFRSWLDGVSLTAALLPMTGIAFLLFTFYMVTDPATTPGGRAGQVLFGLGMAASYGLMVHSHIVFGLFFGLTLLCSVRGLFHHARGALARVRERQRTRLPEVPVAVPIPASMLSLRASSAGESAGI